MKSSTRNLIKHALDIGALELLPEGRTLKSGRLSPYFFNSGLFTSGYSLSLLGKAYAETIDRHRLKLRTPKVIFGPAYKGITLAVVAAVFSDGGMEYAHDRKEAKDHGEGGLIVGATLEGKRVVIVDDVITTGGTKAEAVRTVREHGGIVTGVVIGLDRQERGVDSPLSASQQFSEENGVPVFAAATLHDLINFLKRHPAYERAKPGIVNKIIEYRNEYGIS